MRRPESSFARPSAHAPMGVLVAAGQEGVGASVTAALLAMEARADGYRVLLVGPSLRAQRLAALFRIAFPSMDAPPVMLAEDLHVCGSIPEWTDAEVIISVPSSRAQSLADAADELAARTTAANALVLAERGAASLAAAFAVLKLVIGRRPQYTASVSPCGDADVTALHDAVERWLGRPLHAAPSIPLDPTLPVALSAGISLAEAVADTALTTAAGALWSALASTASTGVPA